MSEASSGRGGLVVDEIEDPYLRHSVKLALHLRRYMPFYVFGTIWALTLALLPSIQPGGDELFGQYPVAAGSATPAGISDSATTEPGPATAAAAATTGGAASPAAARSRSGGRQTAAAAMPPEAAVAAIQRGTGTTRLGTACTGDTLQIPDSSYAVPCQNAYNGPNGGSTSRGVTDKEITIVRRKFPDSANSAVLEQYAQAAGYASPDVTEEVRKTFIDYFNKSYELYGRTVKYVVYESQNGDSTSELQSKGKEGACLDAETVAKEIKAFGVIETGSIPFAECAAERQTMVYTAGLYYPESWYRKYHPYLWGGVMECERISHHVAEYIGKRLLNKPAKWAGDAVTRAKTRYFGTYIPDNDGYQSCHDLTKKDLEANYGVTDFGPQYNYQLDVSRFPDQAAQAAIQFSAAGVTTVILACDYISATVLTAAAERQNWHPEWITEGTGGTDLDNSARLYEQNQVNGHLFGPSQLGATEKVIGPASEPGRVYKDATGKTIPDGTSGDYFTLVRLFNLLQAAGPVLTPDNVASGVMTIPPGGAPDYPVGYTSFLDAPDGTPGGGDHTAVDDTREVYWVAEARNGAATGSASDTYYNGADGKDGTYKESMNGQRFRNGEWRTEDPPIYPAH